MKACNMNVSAEHVTKQNSFCFHDAYMVHEMHLVSMMQCKVHMAHGEDTCVQ